MFVLMVLEKILLVEGFFKNFCICWFLLVMIMLNFRGLGILVKIRVVLVCFCLWKAIVWVRLKLVMLFLLIIKKVLFNNFLMFFI